MLRNGSSARNSCCRTYCCLTSGFCGCLQKEFMKQVQSSGVLMIFSQAWVEELYHQVLERNMLGEAGYWGSPEEHSLPLITMLTG